MVPPPFPSTEEHNVIYNVTVRVQIEAGNFRDATQLAQELAASIDDGSFTNCSTVVAVQLQEVNRS